MTICISTNITAMLEDIVAYANVKQAELVQQEPAQLDFPCRTIDLVVLAAAIGNCIQGVDRMGQVGSNYTWEDASFVQLDDEFAQQFENLLTHPREIVLES